MIWEYQNQQPITYSKPRFMDPIHFREQNFEWQPLPGQTAVSTKHIGSFTEKGVAVFFVRIDAGATYVLPAAGQTQLVFVKNGTGDFGTAEQWSRHTAAHLNPGEPAEMRATSMTEIVVLQLPRV